MWMLILRPEDIHEIQDEKVGAHRYQEASMSPLALDTST
jgi:hypothetical protein